MPIPGPGIGAPYPQVHVPRIWCTYARTWDGHATRSSHARFPPSWNDVHGRTSHAWSTLSTGPSNRITRTTGPSIWHARTTRPSYWYARSTGPSSWYARPTGPPNQYGWATG